MPTINTIPIVAAPTTAASTASPTTQASSTSSSQSGATKQESSILDYASTAKKLYGGIKDVTGLTGGSTALSGFTSGGLASGALTAGGGTYVTGAGLAGVAAPINTTAGAATAGAATAGVGLAAGLASFGIGAIFSTLAGKIFGSKKPPRVWFNTLSGDQVSGGNAINNTTQEIYGKINPSKRGWTANIQTALESQHTRVADNQYIGRMMFLPSAPTSTGNIGAYLQQQEYNKFLQRGNVDTSSAGNIGRYLENQKIRAWNRNVTHNANLQAVDNHGLFTFQNQQKKAGSTYQKFATAEGAFGSYSISNKDRLIDKKFADKWVSSVTQIDNAVATIFTPDQQLLIKDGLNGAWQGSRTWGADSSSGAKSVTNSMLLDRYHAIFDLVGREDLSKKLRNSTNVVGVLTKIIEEEGQQPAEQTPAAASISVSRENTDQDSESQNSADVIKSSVKTLTTITKKLQDKKTGGVEFHVGGNDSSDATNAELLRGNN